MKLKYFKESQQQGLIYDNIQQVHTIGVGEPVFKSDLSGSALAALLVSKVEPEDYEAMIVDFLKNKGITGATRLNPEDKQKMITELANLLVARYGGLIDKVNPNII